MKNNLKMNIGYSDHSEGYEASLMAISLGAKIIEKHFTLNKNLKGPDHKASLSPKELITFVKKIRLFEKSLGKYQKKPYKQEVQISKVVRKKILANKDILKNQKFSFINLTTKRSNKGLDASNWDKLIGKKAKKNFKKRSGNYNLIMKLCTITGSRAEFFLLKNLITKINNEKKLKNNLLVTGSHNSALFGNTIKDIKQSNIKIKAIVNLKIKNDRPIDISKYISEGIKKFSYHFNSIKPDLVIILGDRYEIYTAAIAAYILKIPIAHIYGGETTQGVIDEGIRHSITKLSHIHFVSTNRYLKRVKQLGENPKMIFNVGSLGIEALKKNKALNKKTLEKKLGIKFRKKIY